MARHCMPQKQTHQIAITALRRLAPLSGGLGPGRCGRAPSLAIAESSPNTASTNTSTSANASHGPGDQGNRVNLSPGDEACKKLVIPPCRLAPAAQGVLAG